jgi:hypothetical protein
LSASDVTNSQRTRLAPSNFGKRDMVTPLQPAPSAAAIPRSRRQHSILHAQYS